MNVRRFSRDIYHPDIGPVILQLLAVPFNLPVVWRVLLWIESGFENQPGQNSN
jgi:hypothetical protein